MALKLSIPYISTTDLFILVGHVLVGVNPCGRCIVVAVLPQVA
jgi:hypothetical protein